jgi:fatty acid desaturase
MEDHMNFVAWMISWISVALAVLIVYGVGYFGLLVCYNIFTRLRMSKAKEALRGTGNWAELGAIGLACLCLLMAFAPILIPIALGFGIVKILRSLRDHDWAWAERLRMLSWQ